METPKEFTENLKKGIVTPMMADAVLWSYNKRAKNYRDKERDCRERDFWGDRFNNEETNRKKKEELYQKKEEILRCFPERMVCVHRLTQTKNVKVYDYDEEYSAVKDVDVIREGDYYDREEGETVRFKVIEEKVYRYFLYYEFVNHSFHTPIEDYELSKYKDLEVRFVDELITKGEDINLLLSKQFCDKVHAFLTNKQRHGT